MSRPAPNIHLIFPPVTGESTCIIRENGERQTWQRMMLTEHQWDYFDLADLWPGAEVWENEGRYLGPSVMRYLTLRMGSGFRQPHLSDGDFERIEAENTTHGYFVLASE